MPPAKAHRYLVSFIRGGFVDRDLLSGRYRLGARAIELGASALDAIDPYDLSTEAMIELHDELDHTIVLSVWGTRGPVIVRVEEADQLITVSFRLGKSLPLLRTASGLLFTAFLPSPIVGPLIEAELRQDRESLGSKLIRSRNEVQRLLQEVRSRKIARITGDITPGIDAIAVPIFDYRNYPATVITAVGPSGSFDISWNGPVANALRRKCAEIASKLGKRRGTRGE